MTKIINKFVTTVLSFSLIFSYTFTNASASTKTDALNETSTNFPEESVEKSIGEISTKSIYNEMNAIYTIDENNYTIEIDPITGERSKIVEMVVKIGKVIVEYLMCEVIDGIVRSATGESTSHWVDVAIAYVLNKPYSSTVTIDCDYYAPHSQEYYFCIYGA